jgi:DNA recombination protein RmuC
MMFVYGILVGIVLTSIVFIIVYKTLSKSFGNQVLISTQSGLDQTLSPFKEKIDDYNKSLIEFKEKNIEQHAILNNELKHVMEQAQRMELETKDLTHALKGDAKAQGDWGEIILSRSMEISGLEEGREYVLQGTGLGLKDEDGNQFRPDLIINLPNNGHIVVDSKVSLKSLHEENIKDLKKSLTNHIDGLSKKAYQKLDGLNSPDFVIMFIPLEAIMPIMFKEFPEILDYAAKKNITLATPISILPILKTISSLWRVEKQNSNGVEIAKKAGLLYDKFVVLYEGMQSTNELIRKLSDSHESSMNRISEGKGDVLTRVEELREMGAKTSKQLTP